MKIVVCIVIGYLLGSLSPAAWLSKRKKNDLRKHGTKNLGATNVMLVMGKGYGALVMLCDIAKAFAAVRLAEWLFPSVASAGILAGSAAVAGHVYPFYLNWKGGKGLAAFGGMVLGVDPLLFVILLVITVVLMLIVNYGVAMPMSAAVLFPILYDVRGADPVNVLIAVAVGALIVYKHFSNIGKAVRGEDIRVRDYIREHLFR